MLPWIPRMKPRHWLCGKSGFCSQHGPLSTKNQKLPDCSYLEIILQVWHRTKFIYRDDCLLLVNFVVIHEQFFLHVQSICSSFPIPQIIPMRCVISKISKINRWNRFLLSMSFCCKWQCYVNIYCNVINYLELHLKLYLSRFVCVKLLLHVILHVNKLDTYLGLEFCNLWQISIYLSIYFIYLFYLSILSI